MPTKDLASFSIHTPQNAFKRINDQFIIAGMSTAKSANVGFLPVVQLFAPSTNPAMHLAEKSLQKNLFVDVNNVHINITFSRVSVML